MPAIELNQITIGGPCKIKDGGNTFYFEEGVKVTPKPTWRAIPSSVGGEIDDTLVDLVWEITGRPMAVWNATYQAEFLPAALTNFSTTGVPLLGTSNNLVSIIGADGNGFDFTRCVLTGMPSVFLGLGKSLWNSDAKWTAFLGNGNNLTDTNAFMIPNTTAWSQTDYPTTHQELLAQLAWGAVSGWSSVFAEEGFMLTHESKLDPVKQGNITVDMKVNGYRAMLAFNPQQPTTAQLLAALAYEGAGGGIGIRRSALANDAVVTAGNLSVTVKSAGLRTGAFNFDSKLNRHGEVALVSALSVPGNRLALV